jgi:hypothetical protein
LESAVTLFPNPSHGNLRVSFGQGVRATVVVRSAMGLIISTHHVTSDFIDLELPPVSGPYLVEVISGEGSHTWRVMRR